MIQSKWVKILSPAGVHTSLCWPLPIPAIRSRRSNMKDIKGLNELIKSAASQTAPWFREGGRFKGSEGYILIMVNGKRVPEHKIIAEKALGKSLPEGAMVHHFDGNRQNNHYSNLVICPNSAYHHLLHTRARDMIGSYDEVKLHRARWRRRLKRERRAALGLEMLSPREPDPPFHD